MRTLTLAALLALVLPSFAAEPPRPPTERQKRLAEMQEEAEPYKAYADEVLALLAKGDTEAVKARMSPSTVRRTGTTKLDEVLDTKLVPYFARFDKIDPESIVVARTSDAEGRKGFVVQYAFYVTTGERRGVLLYVIREDEKLTIANIVPGRSIEEASRVRPKQ